MGTKITIMAEDTEVVEEEVSETTTTTTTPATEWATATQAEVAVEAAWAAEEVDSVEDMGPEARADPAGLAADLVEVAVEPFISYTCVGYHSE